MVEKDQALQAGNELFEAFVEQVKLALDHLYDFAYLQRHSLARIYDGETDMSAKTAGRQLRHELITAIEALKPHSEGHFRAPDARLYNLLHLMYIESLTIQQAAVELGLSERQAYRDLKRGQESVAEILWNKRLPLASPAEEFSLQSEMARLKLNYSLVDLGDIFQNAKNAIERLAYQQSVDVAVEPQTEPLTLSTDPVLAHQVIVSVLSYTIQQAQPGILSASFATDQQGVTLTLRYDLKEVADRSEIANTAISKLAQRLRWTITYDDHPEHIGQVRLHMSPSSATIVVIDDNEGWIALLERFLEGYDCRLISTPPNQLQRVQDLNPSAIILDIMMPEKDGWEILQRLRTQPTTADIPIIVCTVFDDPQLAYSLGASAFLPKPTSREKILEVLKEWAIV